MVGDLREVRRSVEAECSGCPRNKVKLPIMFERDASSVKKIRFVVVSQEPVHVLRARGEAAEAYLVSLCKDTNSAGKVHEESKMVQPLSKIISIFGPFDPVKDDVYWTHALKCCPASSDRDVTKEWRKAGKACAEHLKAELEAIGQAELNLIAIGKYAAEMCLYIFDGQDIDQELSISEVMQSNKLPMSFQVKWKSGRTLRVDLFLFTNPGKDVCTVLRKGGKMTVDEIQELEASKIREIRSRP